MNNQNVIEACVQSAPNIAWIKYWGKYDDHYILPLNDSLGITLNHSDFKTTTCVQFTNQISENKLILNQQQLSISNRIAQMLLKMKNKAYKKLYSQHLSPQEWQHYHFFIKSYNSFPTASGMASSASGLSCLAATLNELFQRPYSETELSQIARMGSGSACRSLYGGLVRWRGVNQTYLPPPKIKDLSLLQNLSKQCISQMMIKPSDLSYIKVIVLLAHQQVKKIPSTVGMKRSVETSLLINQRNLIALKRTEYIQKQILQLLEFRKHGQKDKEAECFNNIMETIIRDSNQFHAICLDSYPPITYLDSFSYQIMQIIDEIINPSLTFKVAYTFDAGPHAFLFVHQTVFSTVFTYFRKILKVPEEKLNQKAKLQANKQFQNQKNIQLKQYQKKVIDCAKMWVSQVGESYKRIY